MKDWGVRRIYVRPTGCANVAGYLFIWVALSVHSGCLGGIHVVVVDEVWITSSPGVLWVRGGELRGFQRLCIEFLGRRRRPGGCGKERE